MRGESVRLVSKSGKTLETFSGSVELGATLTPSSTTCAERVTTTTATGWQHWPIVVALCGWKRTRSVLPPPPLIFSFGPNLLMQAQMCSSDSEQPTPDHHYFSRRLVRHSRVGPDQTHKQTASEGSKTMGPIGQASSKAQARPAWRRHLVSVRCLSPSPSSCCALASVLSGEHNHLFPQPRPRLGPPNNTTQTLASAEAMQGPRGAAKALELTRDMGAPAHSGRVHLWPSAMSVAVRQQEQPAEYSRQGSWFACCSLMYTPEIYGLECVRALLGNRRANDPLKCALETIP